MNSKRVIFVIQPHSIVDTITNSSSELFIIEGKEKELVEDIIRDIYPNYLSEYNELLSTKELSNSDLDTYLGYTFYTWGKRKEQLTVLSGFTFDEMYIENKDDKYEKYSLRYDDQYNFVNDTNRERVIKALDPNNNLFFLFSLGDNPNFEMQEELELIGQRIHLG